MLSYELDNWNNSISESSILPLIYIILLNNLFILMYEYLMRQLLSFEVIMMKRLISWRFYKDN